MKLTRDMLQDEIILIKHHLQDITESLDSKELDYAREGLKDIGESCDRLQKFLSPPEEKEVNRIAPEKKSSRTITLTPYSRLV